MSFSRTIALPMMVALHWGQSFFSNLSKHLDSEELQTIWPFLHWYSFSPAFGTSKQIGHSMISSISMMMFISTLQLKRARIFMELCKGTSPSLMHAGLWRRLGDSPHRLNAKRSHYTRKQKMSNFFFFFFGKSKLSSNKQYKPVPFSRIFPIKNFTIFLVKSKLSTANQCKTVTFSRIF